MNEIYETPLVDLCWESEFGTRDDLESATFIEAEESPSCECPDRQWAPASL